MHPSRVNYSRQNKPTAGVLLLPVVANKIKNTRTSRYKHISQQQTSLITALGQQLQKRISFCQQIKTLAVLLCQDGFGFHRRELTNRTSITISKLACAFRLAPEHSKHTFSSCMRERPATGDVRTFRTSRRKGAQCERALVRERNAIYSRKCVCVCVCMRHIVIRKPFSLRNTFPSVSVVRCASRYNMRT